MTKYNSKPAVEGVATAPEELVKPYSNLCGLFAIIPDAAIGLEESLQKYSKAIERASAASEPAYD